MEVGLTRVDDAAVVEMAPLNRQWFDEQEDPHGASQALKSRPYSCLLSSCSLRAAHDRGDQKSPPCSPMYKNEDGLYVALISPYPLIPVNPPIARVLIPNIMDNGYYDQPREWPGGEDDYPGSDFGGSRQGEWYAPSHHPHYSPPSQGSGYGLMVRPLPGYPQSNYPRSHASGQTQEIQRDFAPPGHGSSLGGLPEADYYAPYNSLLPPQDAYPPDWGLMSRSQQAAEEAAFYERQSMSFHGRSEAARSSLGCTGRLHDNRLHKYLYPNTSDRTPNPHYQGEPPFAGRVRYDFSQPSLDDDASALPPFLAQRPLPPPYPLSERSSGTHAHPPQQFLEVPRRRALPPPRETLYANRPPASSGSAASLQQIGSWVEDTAVVRNTPESVARAPSVASSARSKQSLSHAGSHQWPPVRYDEPSRAQHRHRPPPDYTRGRRYEGSQPSRREPDPPQRRRTAY